MTPSAQSRALGQAAGSEPSSGEPLSFPASFAQQRLWFLHHLDPGTGAYNLPVALRLEGPLDAEALEASVNEILRRHDVLRTTFPVRDGIPVQVVSAHAPILLQRTDLRHLAPAAGEREAARLASAESIRPFDLAAGPVFRATLLRLAVEDHVLILTMHHIVSDGWSVGVLLRELAALYGAYRAGEPSPLPELPIQYADYALSEREWLRGDVLEAELAYWRRQLEGVPALLEVPTDRPRAAVQTTRGSALDVALSADLLRGLKTLGRRNSSTLFMTLLAAFHALLSRHTGQEDIPVGSPIAGRTQVETEGLIGFFVNTLVLRGDVSGDPTFRQLLARVREATLGAYAHQELPFERLVEELQPARALSHTPLFQVMFQFIAPSGEEAAIPGLRTRPFPLEEEVAKFDLSLRVIARQDSLSCSIEFNRDLYDPETIRRLLDHWRILLTGIVSDPDLPLSRLPLIDEEERRRLLVDWNATDVPYPREKTLPALIEAQAAATPEAVAVVHGGSRMTYGELNARANRLARYLRKRRVGPDVLVGLCVERSLDMVVGILGILKAGGAYVPLDPHYPRERVAFILDDSAVSVVLTQASLAGSPLEGPFGRVRLDADWPVIEKESGENLEPVATPGNLAYVIYTSGSTGRPKGVAIEHRSAVAFIHWAQSVFDSDDLAGVLASTSICFDLSVFELFVTLSSGGAVVLAENALQLSSLPHADRVSLINTVPSVMTELLRLGALPVSVRTVNFCGEPLPTRLVKQTYEERSVQRVFDLYGPSESTTYSTVALRTVTGPETIGRPIANTHVHLLDRRGQPVPIGLPGELSIGGEGLARGYLGRPELTAERFVPDAFGERPGTRLYKTGDLARYRPDGNIEFLGRSDRQVKVRGFRIELEEIEAVLTEHPEVGDAVVLVREDVPGDKRLVAYVVARNERPPVTSELSRYLGQKLPEHMVPSAFVTLGALPVTPNGKVDRRALPPPERDLPESRKSDTPQDGLELALVRIWEKVLNVQPIGTTDNFFDLGGHSLLAVRLFSQIERVTGKQLPLVTLFQAPTVAQLAETLRATGWKPLWSSLVPIQPGGSKAPFYCVHAVGGNVLTYFDLARHLGPTQPVYGLQAQGLDGKRAPHDTIEEMAAYYVREIREFQSEGPYSLGGSSAGGLVAFEMAQQLHAQGQEVAVLALFDTWGPEYARVMPGLTPGRLKAAHLLQRVDLHFGNFLVAEGWSGKLTYLLTKSNRLRRRLEKRGRKYWRKVREIPQEVFNPLPLALRRVEKKSRRAIDIYEARPYPGLITLFRATKQPAGIYPDPHLGWSRVAGGGVEVYEVPGYHGAIVYEPRIKVLAEQLGRCLAKAQARASSGTPAQPETAQSR